MFTCGVVYDCSRPKRRHNSERSHTFYIGFCHAGGKTWLKIGQNQEFLYEKRAVNFVNTIKIYQLKSQFVNHQQSSATDRSGCTSTCDPTIHIPPRSERDQ